MRVFAHTTARERSSEQKVASGDQRIFRGMRDGEPFLAVCRRPPIPYAYHALICVFSSVPPTTSTRCARTRPRKPSKRKHPHPLSIDSRAHTIAHVWIWLSVKQKSLPPPLDAQMPRPVPRIAHMPEEHAGALRRVPGRVASSRRAHRAPGPYARTALPLVGQTGRRSVLTLTRLRQVHAGYASGHGGMRYARGPRGCCCAAADLRSGDGPPALALKSRRAIPVSEY